MSKNLVNGYDIDPHLAEIYDQNETDSDDLDLIRKLIGEHNHWHILEPFCGTGRLLIPLALDGHVLVGIDQAQGMLECAQSKIDQLAIQVRKRIKLTKAEALEAGWPQNFDLVILGGNCFYELATLEEQEACIKKAAEALTPGGYVYVDNDHMEGGLAESWQSIKAVRRSLTEVCQDGTKVESSKKTVWVDVPHRLARFQRRVKIEFPEGQIQEKEYFQQKHPISTIEVRNCLERTGFAVEQLFGDHTGSRYTDASPRAIFWARKC
jgi:SAM-dependent methyltransferase